MNINYSIFFYEVLKGICVRHDLLIKLIYFFPIAYSSHITVSFYNTSGANETILVKFNCRNSRAIGPKTRVPFGFPS